MNEHSPPLQMGIGVVGLCLLLLAGVVLFHLFAPVSRAAEVTVIIPEGSGVSAIADILARDGLIRSPLVFTLAAVTVGRSDQLRAGTYTIPPHSSLLNILEQLTTGKGNSTDIVVTIIEGWTSEEIAKKLGSHGLAVDDFSRVVAEGQLSTSDVLITDGKPAGSSLEGYLFPDTYAFFPTSTSQEIITKMVENLESKITQEMKEQIQKSSLSFFEILTLASIIEKEVKTEEERRIAAGIFLRRLADGYPLESDATINFITGQSTTRPTTDDLEVESAYNTYKHTGLPPGPIGNPGLVSIQAVLDPIETEYYYFLTTPEPEGKAIFSKTFEEHLENKAKYYP